MAENQYHEPPEELSRSREGSRLLTELLRRLVVLVLGHGLLLARREWSSNRKRRTVT